MRSLNSRLLRLFAGAFFCLALSGCTVIAVTGTAISVTAGVVGLAADAAIGTAKIVGKGVGKAADALLDDDKTDSSGVNIQYRDSGSSTPAEILEATPDKPPATPSALPQPHAENSQITPISLLQLRRQLFIQ